MWLSRRYLSTMCRALGHFSSTSKKKRKKVMECGMIVNPIFQMGQARLKAIM